MRNFPGGTEKSDQFKFLRERRRPYAAPLTPNEILPDAPVLIRLISPDLRNILPPGLNYLNPDFPFRSVIIPPIEDDYRLQFNQLILHLARWWSIPGG